MVTQMRWSEQGHGGADEVAHSVPGLMVQMPIIVYHMDTAYGADNRSTTDAMHVHMTHDAQSEGRNACMNARCWRGSLTSSV